MSLLCVSLCLVDYLFNNCVGEQRCLFIFFYLIYLFGNCTHNLVVIVTAVLLNDFISHFSVVSLSRSLNVSCRWHLHLINAKFEPIQP